MVKSCEQAAITALSGETSSSLSNALYYCPHPGCTAVFSYNKREGGLQLVEGEMRCDEVVETIAQLQKILASKDLIIDPTKREDLNIHLADLENEATDEGYYKIIY